MEKRQIKFSQLVKGQTRLLNCENDKLDHRHLIHINKFGQITQMPLKTHIYPTLIKHTDGFPPQPLQPQIIKGI